MPELPEVELFRRRMSEHILGQEIMSVQTHNEGRMLPDGLAQLQQVSIGKAVESTTRIGKYLFLHLSGGPMLLWHFGMTGSPKVRKLDQAPHKHARVMFELANEQSLDFVSPRKFSRIKIVHDIAHYQQEHKLGEDALSISVEDFQQAFARKKTGPVKSALLEQRYFAGVGNWIADEMLFQARIHPELPCQDLTSTQLVTLHRLMQQIMLEAIDFDGEYGDLPPQYMVSHRWGDGLCPTCGDPLTKIEVGGRRTYFCARDLS